MHKRFILLRFWLGKGATDGESGDGYDGEHHCKDYEHLEGKELWFCDVIGHLDGTAPLSLDEELLQVLGEFFEALLP